MERGTRAGSPGDDRRTSGRHRPSVPGRHGDRRRVICSPRQHVAERKRLAQEDAALVAELQQALAEIKTLRGFIPICAWCHKVRDDSGFWQQIEVYLDARTDATFSHSICPTCAAEAREELASSDASQFRERPF